MLAWRKNTVIYLRKKWKVIKDAVISEGERIQSVTYFLHMRIIDVVGGIETNKMSVNDMDDRKK